MIVITVIVIVIEITAAGKLEAFFSCCEGYYVCDYVRFPAHGCDAAESTAVGIL
jgi:hypothetical protein